MSGTPFDDERSEAERREEERREEDRRESERRSVYGELLLAAFAAARRPLTFDDLARVVANRGARLSEVADWLSNARSSGLVEDRGFATGPDGQPTGPRLFVLAAEARAVIQVDRRRGQRRAS